MMSYCRRKETCNFSQRVLCTEEFHSSLSSIPSTIHPISKDYSQSTKKNGHSGWISKPIYLPVAYCRKSVTNFCQIYSKKEISKIPYNFTVNEAEKAVFSEVPIHKDSILENHEGECNYNIQPEKFSLKIQTEEIPISQNYSVLSKKKEELTASDNKSEHISKIEIISNAKCNNDRTAANLVQEKDNLLNYSCDLNDKKVSSCNSAAGLESFDSPEEFDLTSLYDESEMAQYKIGNTNRYIVEIPICEQSFDQSSESRKSPGEPEYMKNSYKSKFNQERVQLHEKLFTEKSISQGSYENQYDLLGQHQQVSQPLPHLEDIETSLQSSQSQIPTLGLAESSTVENIPPDKNVIISPEPLFENSENLYNSENETDCFIAPLDEKIDDDFGTYEQLSLTNDKFNDSNKQLSTNELSSNLRFSKLNKSHTRSVHYDQTTMTSVNSFGPSFNFSKNTNSASFNLSLKHQQFCKLVLPNKKIQVLIGVKNHSICLKFSKFDTKGSSKVLMICIPVESQSECAFKI